MRTGCRIAAVYLVLVAMLLRALIPVGWMPNPDAANALPFVICTLHGPMHAAPPGPSQDRHRPDAPCVFAAAAPLAAAGMALALPLPADVSTPVHIAKPHEAVLRGTVHRPNAARAPPTFA